MTPITVVGNGNVQDRIIYHGINPLSPHVNVPYFPRRKYVILYAITMNSSLDYANMYHRMNYVLQNEATIFPQIYVIDDVAVTNQSNQSVKGCVSKKKRQSLTPNIVSGNDNVQDIIVCHRINLIS